ncbi:MAG TPA: 2-dehydropantoate 2-reductase N-terminal domain-containing protein [Kofleriaceae bacterium]|jgi:glycerol-3-phosphate dehydrogenase (NAD(P)+)|nr:2-dehydropantoate 2-reductase N-terminal domain-containing protein [Kofleriaceae bacterium]
MTARRDTIGIVGAGRFGTALGSVLARAGRRVVLWSRDAAVVEAIRTSRRCPRLPGALLPEPLEATSDPRRLAGEARFVVLAVSSTDVRARARELGDVIDGSHIVVHAIGALAAPSNDRVSQVMEQGLPTLKLGAIAGPALPDDLAEGNSSSMVIASTFDEVVAEGRRLLNAPPGLRVYGSHDLVGVELASALSGAFTVVLGLSDALGVPPVTRAVLITRALAEASRLGAAAGADPRTFAGLAGLGNLLVRASERSADYQLGRRLAEGVAAAATPTQATTEGARAALAGAELARRLGARVPVLQGIAAVLTGRLEPRQAASLISDTVAEAE